MPRLSASTWATGPRTRSVLNGPGSRPLMVTLLITVFRAMPATKPVRPERAPLERPRTSIGDFTAAEVMLTMRPNFRAMIASTVALISSIGVSMLASIALIQSSRVQLRKSPGGGPPALLTRMSGSGQAFSAASRPAGVVMSPATSVTVTPGLALRMSSAALARTSAPRAVIVTCTPSAASAAAQARPNPLLDAHTSARRPLIPRSTVLLPVVLMTVARMERSAIRVGVSTAGCPGLRCAPSGLQIRAQLRLDHVGGLFADHDGRRVGVAADQGRHHGGIDHAQAFDAVDLQFRIDHGHRVVDAHLGCADRVINGVDTGAQHG